MREILFRGKDFYNDQWIEGYLLKDENGEYAICDIDEINYCVYWHYGELVSRCARRVYNEMIGQYTGLTDIHGVKVFEGDIIKCYTGRICKVTFFTAPSYSGFDLTAIGNLDKPAPHSWRLFEDMEVIGNIYDNPELLI